MTKPAASAKSPAKKATKVPPKGGAPSKPALKAAPRASIVEVADAVFVASSVDESSLTPPQYAEIAVAGRSNVGKSSLLNFVLARRKLVRTSSTPGCTRGLNLFRATLKLADGSLAMLDLCDLPGYGFAQRSKDERRQWGSMIEGYLERRVGLRVVLVLVDARRGLEDEDRQLLEYLEHIGKHAIVVVTKVDKLKTNERFALANDIAKAARGAQAVPVILTSADESIGRDELWRALLRATSIGRAES